MFQLIWVNWVMREEDIFRIWDLCVVVWIRRKLSGLSRVEEQRERERERNTERLCNKLFFKSKKNKGWLHCTFSDTTPFFFSFGHKATRAFSWDVLFTRRWLICRPAVSLGSPLSPTVPFSFSSLFFFIVGTHLSITKLLV